jgi:hypothetical protein
MLPMRGSNEEFEKFKREWEAKVARVRLQTFAKEPDLAIRQLDEHRRRRGLFGPGFSQDGNW